MKVEITFKLLFVGALIVCSHSLSIRDFSSDELDDVVDVQPDYKEYAVVARYVVHKSDWASIGTISTQKNMSGFPMVNLKSVADSARDESSTGFIYFYLTNLDFTGQDLLKNNKVTAMFSNDQDLECSSKGVDPMEPTCSRIIISGSVVKLDEKSDEYKFANRAFLSRHPAAANWIVEHAFYLCKLDISQIIVLDWYGGAKYVIPKDYYNVKDASNGFLDDEISSKTVQHISDHHQVNPNVDRRRREEKIRIKVKKGNEVVMIEL